MSRKYEALVRLSHLAGAITLRSALEFVGEYVDERVPAALDLTLHEGRVALCRLDPEIQEAIKGQRKIQAIKTLRDRVSAAGLGHPHSSLKACKDAVDDLLPTPRYF